MKKIRFLIGFALCVFSIKPQSDAPINTENLIKTHQISHHIFINEENPYIVHRKLVELWSENVLGFFDLEETFSTPLQIKTFEKSPEYTVLLNEIKAQKANLSETEFAITISETLGAYDIQSGSFLVNYTFGNNPVESDTYSGGGSLCDPSNRCATVTTAEARKETKYANASRGFILTELAGRNNKKATITWSIKVPEEIAAKLENTQTKVLYTFVVKGLKKKREADGQNVSRRMPNGYSARSNEKHVMDLILFETKLTRIVFTGPQGEILHSIEKR